MYADTEGYTITFANVFKVFCYNYTDKTTAVKQIQNFETNKGHGMQTFYWNFSKMQTFYWNFSKMQTFYWNFSKMQTFTEISQRCKHSTEISQR